MGATSGEFFRPFFLRFTRECQYPTFVPWTHSLALHKGGLTHTDIRTLWWGYPTQRPPSKDPPRLSCFWRRRLFAFSLFFCRRVLSHCASMLLTLDHWTKIDSTAAAAAFQLFLFYPLFRSIPHSLYQFAFTFLHISSFANHCFPLKLLLVPLSLSVHSTLLLALVYSAISAAAPHDDVDGQLLLLVLSGPLKWPKYNPAGTTSSCCTTTSRSIPVSDVP